jgi:hypothetical protein
MITVVFYWWMVPVAFIASGIVSAVTEAHRNGGYYDLSSPGIHLCLGISIGCVLGHYL